MKTKKDKKPRDTIFKVIKRRAKDFLARRPHRSFRLSERRDYARDFPIKGYWAFSAEVWQIIWRHKKLFGGVVLTYAVLSVLAVGMISQDSYNELSGYLQEAGDDVYGGDLGGLTRALVIFGSTIMGDLNSAPSEAQQIYAGLLALLAWLTVVWLLRQIIAGHAVKLRDGIYSSGAPIVASFIVILVMFAQLLPVAVGFIGLQAAQASGIGEAGVEAMVLWAAVALLGLASLYWLTSSFIALVLVTLPGMYPFVALKEAGEVVLGRRLRVMLRVVWLVVCVLAFWAVVLIPAILIDRLLNIAWLPLVPVMIVLVGAVTVVWSAAYVYMLYRRLIDVQPAR